MDAGAFEDLPFRGQRLPIEDDSAAGEWALAHRMLKNAGLAPPWIESDKEARAPARRARRRCWSGRGAHRELARGACARLSGTVAGGEPGDRTGQCRGADRAPASAAASTRRPRSNGWSTPSTVEATLARRWRSAVRPRTAPRPPRANASVWRSTSASVVAGDMSAMLWNGVISTRRFIAHRWRKRSSSGSAWAHCSAPVRGGSA